MVSRGLATQTDPSASHSGACHKLPARLDSPTWPSFGTYLPAWFINCVWQPVPKVQCLGSDRSALKSASAASAASVRARRNSGGERHAYTKYPGPPGVLPTHGSLVPPAGGHERRRDVASGGFVGGVAPGGRPLIRDERVSGLLRSSCVLCRRMVRHRRFACSVCRTAKAKCERGDHGGFPCKR